MNQIENVIKLVTDYIKERGLEIKEIVMPTEENAFVRVWTTEARIRSIDLKAFMEFSGVPEYRIGYDAVDFIPQADIHVWNGEVLVEDPHIKAEDAKKALLEEFEGTIQESELVVEQKRGPKVAEGTNNFTFTVTTNEISGQLSERMYIDKLIPTTSMADIVADQLREDRPKAFGPDEVKEELGKLERFQLVAMKEDLERAAGMAGKFGVEHAKPIYARIDMIDQTLALKPEPVYNDEDEDEEPCYEDMDQDGEGREADVAIIGIVNLDKEELKRMDSNKLLYAKRHLENAREQVECIPSVRDAIDNCLALIKEVEEEQE